MVVVAAFTLVTDKSLRDGISKDDSEIVPNVIVMPNNIGVVRSPDTYWKLIGIESVTEMSSEINEYEEYDCNFWVSKLMNHSNENYDFYNIGYTMHCLPNIWDNYSLADMRLKGQYTEDVILLEHSVFNPTFPETPGIYDNSVTMFGKLDVWYDVNENHAGGYGLDVSITVAVQKGEIFTHTDTHEIQTCKQTLKFFDWTKFSDFKTFSFDVTISIEGELVKAFIEET